MRAMVRSFLTADAGLPLFLRQPDPSPSAENRDQDIFQTPDNECTVGLVAELVARPCCFPDFTIRMGLREGGKVGIEEIYIELLLDGDGSGAVKLLQKQLVLQLVILELHVPATVIAVPDIVQAKGMREIGEDIFKRIICCFDLKDAELQIGKTLGSDPFKRILMKYCGNISPVRSLLMHV